MPRFFAGAYKPSSIPPETLAEVAFVGRSNVGKSSLLNALGGPRISAARTSPSPGLTHQLNFFTVADWFHFVDMPGYGFAFAKEQATAAWKDLVSALFLRAD